MGRFGVGNARKLLSAPLYALGALASRLVHRDDRLWAFGSGTGYGEGARALLEYAREADPTLRLVWLARTPDECRAVLSTGVACAVKDSWRGFRLTLRARVVVVTHGFGDVNRYGTRGALVVQLWHGIPHKRLHLDSAAEMGLAVLGRLAPARRLLRRAYVAAGRGIALFPVASPRAGERIRSAFALRDDQIAVTGDPRDDVLHGDDPEGARHDARARLARLLDDERLLDRRLLLYAPTWRDDTQDPTVPDQAQQRAIRAYLERSDALLLVRAHPLSRTSLPTDGDRVLALDTATAPDITGLLSAFDALLTDYSSIVFDYALVGGETYFLAPDASRYARRQGVYEPYRWLTGGADVRDWTALVGALERSWDDPSAAERSRDHTRRLAERFHSHRDGRNTERVFDEIARLVRGEPLLHGLGSPRAAHPTPMLRLDAARVETSGPSPVLVLEGLGAHETRPSRLALEGARLVVAGELTVDADRWSARLTLTHARWGGSERPIPSGDYRLVATRADGTRIDLDSDDEPLTGARHRDLLRCALRRAHGVLTLHVTPALRDDELGPAHQKRLEADYRRGGPAHADAVFFESYYGQSAAGNPLGIDRALARIAPDLTRYWSVTDSSVEVPEGAIAVLEGSAEWWTARAESRLLVVNDWLRKRYRRRPGQRVLQTWHGTPLKRLALSRHRVGPRTAVAILRESRRWDLLLAQNPFAAEVLRRSYAFRGPIWQEGYPRNDVLVHGDPEAVRRRLGLDPEHRVVLYAPTWRDDSPGEVDHVDAARFASLLGEDHITLVRGHSRSLRPGASVVGERVVDVTDYPDITELYLVADVLVTDYSSAMFDFTATGKPIYFFVPDLDEYRDRARGFTFDLAADAPGPVLQDAAELARRIRETESDSRRYAERYQRWRERFNPREDGSAGERVVRRLLAEGLLGPEPPQRPV